MNNRHTIPLDQLTHAHEARSGAKAYNCAKLKQAGFQVPDGLVVLSSATGDDLAAIADHPWFNGLPADARFAVRSSGIGEDGDAQSFAGIHQTTLNVARANLVREVAACRASGRTPQALEYRRAKGIPIDAIQMGVLIQRMVQPVAAGVAFTINPLSGAGELVINSSWGVGDALVSGQVDPDELVVRKQDGALVWSRIGDKTAAGPARMSLSRSQITELTSILVRIEAHYGAPQDVEWCHDGARFWIVQSRPVTAGRAGGQETEWTRANLAEVFPDLTSPQALASLEEMINRGERQFMGGMMGDERRLGPMVKSFCGRLYFNLAQARHMCALAGTAPAVILRSMGHADAIQPADERASRLPIREQLAAVPDMARVAWRHLRVEKMVRHHQARMQGHLQRFSSTDPRKLPVSEIWSAIDEWVTDGPNCMQAVLLLSGVTIAEAPVRKACEKVGFPYERLVYPQLAAGERSVSAQQAFDLSALADAARGEPGVARYLAREVPTPSSMREELRGTAFLAQFECFLETYGHRGRYESDWSLPRYSEDPTPLIRALRAHLDDRGRRDTSETARRQEAESIEAWEAFTQKLSAWQKRAMLPRIRRSIRRIKQYYLWRELVRSDLVKVLASVRQWHLALADRFVTRRWLDASDDYFLLHLPEIARVIQGWEYPSSLRSLAARRRLELTRYASIQMPLLMRESQLAHLIRTSGVSCRIGDERELTGHPVSGGVVEAEVVVVRDPGDFDRMKPGAILVAPATDPSWTPLFTLASGVIVEVGGVLSHASTIAREYGLPALANVKHATKRLNTGERVRLDAMNGIVQRLEAAASAVEADAVVRVA